MVWNGLKFVTCLLPEVSNGLFDANHVQALCIAHNRSDETLFGCNSNADIHVVLVHDGVTASWTLNSCVHSRNILHSQHSSLGECAHEAKLDACLLEDLILVVLTQVHQLRHVDLVEGGERSGSVLRLLQALSDPQTHAVHLDSVLRSSAVRRFGLLLLGLLLLWRWFRLFLWLRFGFLLLRLRLGL